MNLVTSKVSKNMKSIKTKKGIILDTKSFVLFIIGSLFPEKITRFNRTKEFSRDNFRELQIILSKYFSIYITPYILNEFSHLTLEENGLSKEEKVTIADLIKSIKVDDQIKEILLPMTNIFSNKHITIIGAGDASLIETNIDKNIPILTSDGIFADIARSQGKTAFKFLPILGLVDY